MLTVTAALLLGLVEGLTEFLPVSSTGHLILTSSLLGLSGEKVASFEIVIQFGAILAVVAMYRRRFAMLLLPGEAAPTGSSAQGRTFSGIRGLWLLFLTSLPASILGLLASDFIKAHLFGPQTVAWALGVGALAILAVERLRPAPRHHTLDDMTPLLALGIGLFQCLALWPGFSRSAATIMGGMVLGADRRLAAEYSFIAAVPIMAAATAYDLLKSWHLFSSADLGVLAIGFVVSFLSAWLAVKVFIRLVSRWSLAPFAWYRLVLAPLVLLFWPKG